MSLKDFQNGFALGMKGNGNIAGMTGAQDEGDYINAVMWSSATNSKKQNFDLYSTWANDRFPTPKGKSSTVKFDLEATGIDISSDITGTFKIYLQAYDENGRYLGEISMRSKTYYLVSSATNKILTDSVAYSLSNTSFSDVRAIKIYIQSNVNGGRMHTKFRIYNVRVE